VNDRSVFKSSAFCDVAPQKKSLDTDGLNEQIVYALPWTIWQRRQKYAILHAQGPVLAERAFDDAGATFYSCHAGGGELSANRSASLRSTSFRISSTN
jgi:hypothetical protein